MQKIKRYIACYDKDTSQLIKTIVMPTISIQALSEAINRVEIDIKEDPLLYYDYPINETNIDQLQSALSVDIPTRDYYCYIECVSENDQEDY